MLMRSRQLLIARLLPAMIALASWVSGAGTAGAGIDYSRQGHWRSALPLPIALYDFDTIRIIENGDVIYVSGTASSSMSDRLYAIDFSDPVHPVVTDSLSSYFADVVRDGNLLYVASGMQGLNIVSLADPRHPRVLSHIDLVMWAHYARVHDGMVYVSTYNDDSVHVVDASNPAHPALLGVIEQPWGIRFLEFAGDTAYMAAKDELRIVDLSDPLRPVAIGVIDQPGWLHDFAVTGNLGIVVRDDAVHLLDLENPAHPMRLASIKWPAQAYEQEVHVADGLLFVSNYFGAMGWDISRPDQPVELGEIRIPDGFRGLGLGIGRVHMALGVTSLPLIVATMDLSSRDLVRGEEMVPITTASPSFGITDDLLVSVLGTELIVTDIRDPRATVTTGRVDIGPWSSIVFGNQLLDVEGSLAAIHSYGTVERGFRIVDFSDPHAPAVRGLIPLDPGTNGVIGLRGDLAVTVSIVPPWSGDPEPLSHELAVFDLTNPDVPTRVGALAIPAGSEQLLVEGDLAICIAYNGVNIYDIADPAEPRLASLIAGGAMGMGLNGHDLYLGLVQGGFRVFDLSDPALPRPTWQFRTIGMTDRFAFDGNIVYANDYLSGCQVIDMSDPGDPMWVGSLLNPIVDGMQVHGDWVHFGSHAAPRHVAAAPSGAPSPREAAAPLAATVHPNPFNPAAVVGFELGAHGPVRVTVHDVAGRCLATVVDAVLEAGHHAVRWDGSVAGGKAAAGTYFFCVSAGGVRQSVKAVLLK